MNARELEKALVDAAKDSSELVIKQKINEIIERRHNYEEIKAKSPKLAEKLGSPPSVNYSYYDHNSALFYAVDREITEIVELLVKAGADVNFSSTMHSPLSIAIEKNNTKIVKILLDAGASIDINCHEMSNYPRYLYEEKSWIPISPLDQAIRNNNLNIIQMLLEKGAKINQSSHIIWSYNKNWISLVKLLLKYVVLTKDNQSWFLHESIKKNDISMVETLITEHKIDPDTKRYGVPALSYAAKLDNLEIVKKLLSLKADVNFPDNFNTTPLMVSIFQKNMQMFELFMQHGAKIDARDSRGLTLAMHAAAKGQLEILILCLDKYKTDVNIRDFEENTLLIHATKHGHLETVKTLLDKYKVSVDQKNRRGKTALLYAVKNNHGPMVELLLEHQANLHVKVGYFWKKTLFDIAAKNPNMDCFNKLVKAAEKEIRETSRNSFVEFFRPKHYVSRSSISRIDSVSVSEMKESLNERSRLI